MEKEKETFLCHQIGRKAELEYIFEHAVCDASTYPCSRCPYKVECEFRTSRK
jgi:hypothetical protein